MNVILIMCDTWRLDHCGPYNHGKPLNECWNPEQPAWVVPTSSLDRLAERGTVFENCWSGSFPTKPARRDILTGRYDFLERGWGPLEHDDLDLPRQVSGPRRIRSVYQVPKEGFSVSYLISEGGKFHTGYTGFEFMRGRVVHPWYIPRRDLSSAEEEQLSSAERYFRRVHLYRHSEKDETCAQVFTRAAEWLERNHAFKDFFLHIDIMPPHEPWDPPEELVKIFDPKGYDVEGWNPHPPYVPWRGRITEEQFNSFRACYAATVVLVDRWLGRLLDTIDRLDLWKNTLLIFMTDHGTFNGDHGRIGKLQTHLHDAQAHIPFIMVHPELAHGQRRSQLVQLVDVYSTTLAATGRPIPPDRHGLNLLPVLEDANAKTRDYAVAGFYGHSVTITDGDWILHQAPLEANKPLYWYGHCLSTFFKIDLGLYIGGRREAQVARFFATPTWLTDKRSDPSEVVNLAQERPHKLREMQRALKQKLIELKAPVEQLDRLGLREV